MKMQVNEIEVSYFGINAENCRNWKPEDVLASLTKSTDTLINSTANITRLKEYDLALRPYRNGTATADTDTELEQQTAKLADGLRLIEGELNVLASCGWKTDSLEQDGDFLWTKGHENNIRHDIKMIGDTLEHLEGCPAHILRVSQYTDFKMRPKLAELRAGSCSRTSQTIYYATQVMNNDIHYYFCDGAVVVMTSAGLKLSEQPDLESHPNYIAAMSKVKASYAKAAKKLRDVPEPRVGCHQDRYGKTCCRAATDRDLSSGNFDIDEHPSGLCRNQQFFWSRQYKEAHSAEKDAMHKRSIAKTNFAKQHFGSIESYERLVQTNTIEVSGLGDKTVCRGDMHGNRERVNRESNCNSDPNCRRP